VIKDALEERGPGRRKKGELAAKGAARLGGSGGFGKGVYLYKTSLGRGDMVKLGEGGVSLRRDGKGGFCKREGPSLTLKGGRRPGRRKATIGGEGVFSRILRRREQPFVRREGRGISTYG